MKGLRLSALGEEPFEKDTGYHLGTRQQVKKPPFWCLESQASGMGTSLWIEPLLPLKEAKFSVPAAQLLVGRPMFTLQLFFPLYLAFQTAHRTQCPQ